MPLNDKAPETPAEVEALLEKMKDEGITIGTTLENAELLAAAVIAENGQD